MASQSLDLPLVVLTDVPVQVPPLQLSSDIAILSAIAQRKSVALGQLYDRYGRLIFVVALRITGDHPMAEAVTEAVFHEIWTQVEAIRCEGDSCVAWMLALTRRYAMNATHH